MRRARLLLALLLTGCAYGETVELPPFDGGGGSAASLDGGSGGDGGAAERPPCSLWPDVEHPRCLACVSESDFPAWCTWHDGAAPDGRHLCCAP